jgi:anti-sigma regulatory factor (Ser/Thr protein kinase)
MDLNKPYTVKVKFPGDLEYIPAIRKFMSDIFQANNFSQKFAFRSEIIVDELCSNAVNHGCRNTDAEVELSCLIYSDHVEFQVRDEGGSRENLDKLKKVVEERTQDQLAELKAISGRGGLGLEIVRMLSEEMDLHIDQNNVTSLRVVRKREGERKKNPKE